MPTTRKSRSSTGRTRQKSTDIKLEPPDQSISVADAWIPKKLGGDYPQLTSLCKTLQDPRTGKIYMYGGLAPGDKKEVPKPYFHVCETQNMKFTDLTNSLTFAPPGDPFSGLREKKPLPSLSEPGITLLEISDCSLIFLFGGHDAGEADEPSSALIAIHPEQKEWWYVEFEDHGFPPPAARISCVLVGANEKLYIFGGIEEFGDDWTHHRSYSIVEIQEDALKCKWVAVDVPYPDNVPAGQVFGKAQSVYHGTMILLIPGRENQESKVDFHNDNFFYFLTINNSFQKANPKGDLPKDIHWYYACNFDPSSILMCTWIPYDEEYLIPELWRYSVYPNDKVTCLGISQRVYDLDKDFQRFVLVSGSRIFLMGQGDDKAMCDTYVEIPVQSLL